MYNLTPRMGRKLRKGTPDNIGPNTYTICSRPPFLENFYPFSSSAKRGFAIARRSYTDAQYNPQFRSKRIQGGVSLQNRAERFAYKKEDTPGPGEYDPKRTRKCKRLDPTLIPGRPKLYVCRTPYTVLGSAPSIPTHIDENGYIVGTAGKLTKVLADEHDRTLGPAYYDVPPGEFCFTTKRYKACHWSHSKSKRTIITTNDNPPPGAYETKHAPCRRFQADEEYREMARLFCFLPRYTEGQALKTIKEDLPGPGRYEINTSSVRFNRSMSINSRPFVSAAERLKPVTSDTPSPDQYNIDEYSCGNKAYVPFNVGADRFSKKEPEPTPGPPHYDIKGAIEERLVRKRNVCSSMLAPFNKSGERKLSFVADDAYFLPGPGDYDVEPSQKETLAADGSVFRARAERFPDLPLSDDAGPASYDITETFKRNRGKTSHNAGKVPFNASRPRFVRKASDADKPGPADYVSQGELGDGGLSFNVTPRFKGDGNGVPGPGAYTLHPSAGTCLYRAFDTQNLRLKEYVTRTKFRLSPGATWAGWAEMVQKKKTLRWYAKPPADYRHCVVVV